MANSSFVTFILNGRYNVTTIPSGGGGLILCVQTLSVPASALIFNAHGLAVATVGADHRVRLKPVTITRDLGKLIEIGSGLDAAARVIESPPDGIGNGVEVQIAEEPHASPNADGKAKN